MMVNERELTTAVMPYHLTKGGGELEREEGIPWTKETVEKIINMHAGTILHRIIERVHLDYCTSVNFWGQSPVSKKAIKRTLNTMVGGSENAIFPNRDDRDMPIEWFKIDSQDMKELTALIEGLLGTIDRCKFSFEKGSVPNIQLAEHADQYFKKKKDKIILVLANWLVYGYRENEVVLPELRFIPKVSNIRKLAWTVETNQTKGLLGQLFFSPPSIQPKLIWGKIEELLGHSFFKNDVDYDNFAELCEMSDKKALATLKKEQQSMSELDLLKIALYRRIMLARKHDLPQAFLGTVRVNDHTRKKKKLAMETVLREEKSEEVETHDEVTVYSDHLREQLDSWLKEDRNQLLYVFLSAVADQIVLSIPEDSQNSAGLTSKAIEIKKIMIVDKKDRKRKKAKRQHGFQLVANEEVYRLLTDFVNEGGRIMVRDFKFTSNIQSDSLSRSNERELYLYLRAALIALLSATMPEWWKIRGSFSTRTLIKEVVSNPLVKGVIAEMEKWAVEEMFDGADVQAMVVRKTHSLQLGSQNRKSASRNRKASRGHLREHRLMTTIFDFIRHLKEESISSAKTGFHAPRIIGEVEQDKPKTPSWWV